MIESALLYLGAVTIAASTVGLIIAWRLHSARAQGFAAIAGAIGVAFVTYALWAPPREMHAGRPAQRIDSLMPRYQFHEKHATHIRANPLEVDSAIRALTADDIRFYNALTWLRRFGQSGQSGLLDPARGVPMLTLASRTGFQVLGDNPGEEIVLGVLLPISRAANEELDAARGARKRLPFVASKEGYASATLNFRITPNGDGVVLSTETRVFAPDEATRRSFARYWRIIYPGSALIRREWLAAIRTRAERSVSKRRQ